MEDLVVSGSSPLWRKPMQAQQTFATNVMGGHTLNGVRGLDSVRVAATARPRRSSATNGRTAKTMWRGVKGME